MPTVKTATSEVAYLKEGSGPAVLLLQGVGLGAEGWRPQIDELRERFTVIAPDNRGIGGSRAFDSDISIETTAGTRLPCLPPSASTALPLLGIQWGGEDLASAIPGARSIELQNAAHGVPIAQPAVINKLLQQHLLGAPA